MEKPNDNGKPKTRKRVKYVKARAIRSAGKSVLLEWNDGKLRRGFVPSEAYDRTKEQAPEVALKAAIPYGVDWSKAVEQIDGNELYNELVSRGVWTADDLHNNPQLVNTIIMRLAGVSRAALSKFAKGE